MPVIFALRNALFLEPPSQAQLQFAKLAEEERSHVNELELKLLTNKKKISSETDEQANDVLPNEAIEDLKNNASKRKTDVKDKVQFKRKRAKVLVLHLVYLIMFLTFCEVFILVMIIEFW